jgi:lipoate-protein ligase A
MVKVVVTPVSTPDENMEFDSQLLSNLVEPTLHFYRWAEKSVTYGYFIDPKKHFREKSLKENKIYLARRPTGGGIVFHSWDYAFSFLLPANHPKFSLNPLENYQFVNQIVLEVVHQFLKSKSILGFYKEKEEKKQSKVFFCMSKPTIYDLIINGKKIVGAAQRKAKSGFLHQGMISLFPPDWNCIEDVLISGRDVCSEMKKNSAFLLESQPDKYQEESLKQHLQEMLTEKFKDRV